MKKGFTIIELVFVIVVIGILSGIAIIKMNYGRKDAEIANAKVQLASIKAGIMSYYNDKLLTGRPGYPASLGKAHDRLFVNVLPVMNIKEGTNKKGWTKPHENQEKYVFSIGNKQATFTYSSRDGTITCSGDQKLCTDLQ